jgi:type VI secretion system secreted protein VgrG
MPAVEVFRPLRSAPKPRIPGPQTAVVVGAEGEEIDPDAYGRVKVTFHWLLGTPSCWVRVAQSWAGSGYGAMAIPRIGDEVVVAFEDGDPDRPLIVGSVYNGANPFPYDPPAKRTVTAIKSNTSKGGGGFNELRFDDEAGKENMFLHAQKDLDLRVRNDERAFVGNDIHETVGNKVFREIGDQRHETIGTDDLIDIAGDRHATVAGDMLHAVGGNSHLDVGGDGQETYGGKHNLSTGKDLLVESGMNTVATAGKDLHVKAGMNVVIEAGAQITLKTSSGDFITVGPAGVFIKGAMVMINSGGSAGSGPGTKPAAAKIAEMPEKPVAAKRAEPGEVAAPPGSRPRTLTPQEIDSHPTAAALRRARENAAPFCEECEKASRARQADA